MPQRLIAAAWFSILEAVNKITKGQLPIMQALAKKLSLRIPGPSENLPSGKKPRLAAIGNPGHLHNANLTPRKGLGFKTPYQAILAALSKDVQIRSS
jgi:hypothetical protein